MYSNVDCITVLPRDACDLHQCVFVKSKLRIFIVPLNVGENYFYQLPVTSKILESFLALCVFLCFLDYVLR